MSILIAILVFSAIVVIHEFGHFIMARRAGILVEEFAIGMGPKLFGVKPSETLYTLRLLPIGGFCKMLGEDEATGNPRAFSEKSIGARISVILAGAIMNFILAFVIYLIISFFVGFNVPIVSDVVPNSPAQTMGIEKGDKILKVNKSSVNIYEDVIFELNRSKDKESTFVILRNNEKINLKVTPVKDEASDRYMVGIYGMHKSGIFSKSVEGIEKAGIFESIYNSTLKISFFIKSTLSNLISLFTMQLSVKDMSGPVAIVGNIGATYKESMKESLATAILNILAFTAFLSANIGVFNLLPLPALDGGRFIFLLIEAVRKKPVPPEKEGMVHFVGFVLLMVLAVFVAYNDIAKIIFK